VVALTIAYTTGTPKDKPPFEELGKRSYQRAVALSGSGIHHRGSVNDGIMKNILILVISCVALAHGQTMANFDKFKNITDVSTKETYAGTVRLYNGKPASLLVTRMGMIVGFPCQGQVTGCTKSGNSIELLFVGYTSDWSFHRDCDVELLIDGRPASAGKADWDGTVRGSDDLVEYMDTHISPELLRAMSQAKAVEVQLGGFNFSLTGKNLAALRDVATHLK